MYCFSSYFFYNYIELYRQHIFFYFKLEFEVFLIIVVCCLFAVVRCCFFFSVVIVVLYTPLVMLLYILYIFIFTWKTFIFWEKRGKCVFFNILYAVDRPSPAAIIESLNYFFLLNFMFFFFSTTPKFGMLDVFLR